MDLRLDDNRTIGAMIIESDHKLQITTFTYDLMVTIVPTPVGMTDTEFINAFIMSSQSYDDSALYDPFPDPWGFIYNSNSYVSGVLKKRLEWILLNYLVCNLATKGLYQYPEKRTFTIQGGFFMIDLKNLIRFGPIFLNIFLIVWTIIVSPYSKYGDNWAIYPAVAVFPLIILLHIVLLFIEKSKLNFLLYAVIHLGISLVLWIYCLMKISKDSL